MTPRPKDTEGEKRGLSAFDQIENAPGQGGTKVRVIDIDKLQKPLSARVVGGHVSIVPLSEDGEIDDVLLRAWADARDDERPHELTQNVLNAVVEHRVLK